MTLIEILLTFMALLLSFIAIKITIQFDINSFLKDRRKIKEDQLKNICPHARIIDIKGKEIHAESFFSTFPGTYNWVCSQCGLIVNSEEDVNRIMDSYGKNPIVVMKKHKKFIKKAKKLKKI